MEKRKLIKEGSRYWEPATGNIYDLEGNLIQHDCVYREVKEPYLDPSQCEILENENPEYVAGNPTDHDQYVTFRSISIPEIVSPPVWISKDVPVLIEGEYAEGGVYGLTFKSPQGNYSKPDYSKLTKNELDILTEGSDEIICCDDNIACSILCGTNTMFGKTGRAIVNTLIVNPRSGLLNGIESDNPLYDFDIVHNENMDCNDLICMYIAPEGIPFHAAIIGSEKGVLEVINPELIFRIRTVNEVSETKEA